MKSIALHGRLEQWFDVENNDDVREASISDIADDMEQLAIATPAREKELLDPYHTGPASYLTDPNQKHSARTIPYSH